MEKHVIDAMKDINEKLRTSIITSDLLKGHRINQRKDFIKQDFKIVFNEKTTHKLMLFLKDVIKTDCIEYGTYFYGNIYKGFIYFDDFLSDFKLSDGLYDSASVEVTPKNMEELNEKTEMKYTPNPCNSVMHFHTHPDHVIKDGEETVPEAPLQMSEQDLYTYGFHQIYLQPESKNKVIYLGGLISKNNNKPEFSVVMYDETKKCFYTVDNIYFTHHGKLIKIDNSNLVSKEKIELNMDDKMKAKILELQKND